MFECCNVTLYKVNENKVKLNKMLLLCVQAQAGGTTLQCAQVCAQHNSCICKLNICSKNTGCEWRPHSTLHCPISIIHIHLRSAALTSNEEIFCKQQKHAETDGRVSLCLRCFIFLFSNYVHCIKHILVDILNLVDRLFYIPTFVLHTKSMLF